MPVEDIEEDSLTRKEVNDLKIQGQKKKVRKRATSIAV
jgi:hypothetical protein